MKAHLKYLPILLLSGCATIPDSTVNTLANAGGGCVKSSGLWGSIIVIVGNADKGSIRNGEVSVAGDCGGVTIKDSATVRAGTITTTTTTVQPKP